MKLQAIILTIATVVKGQRATMLNNAGKGWCLTIIGGEAIENQKLIMGSCFGTVGQFWLYGTPGQLEGSICPAFDTTLCVTVNETSPEEGAYLAQCKRVTGQQFYFTDGNQLELGSTGLSLTADDSGSASLSPTNSNENKQKWSFSAIAPTQQDFFTLKNRYTGDCVGYSGPAAVAAPLVASLCEEESTHQLWAYIPIIKSIVPYASRGDFGLCLSPNTYNYLLSGELQPCSGFYGERQWDIVGDYVVNYANPDKVLTAEKSGSLPLLDLNLDIRDTAQEWIIEYPN